MGEKERIIKGGKKGGRKEGRKGFIFQASKQRLIKVTGSLPEATKAYAF